MSMSFNFMEISESLRESKLLINNGENRKPSEIGQNSKMRQARWTRDKHEMKSVRDGLSDFCGEKKISENCEILNFQSDREIADRIDALARANELLFAFSFTDSPALFGEYLRFLIFREFSNSPKTETRRADYFEMISNESFFSVSDEYVDTLMRQIDADVPRTSPNGFRLLFEHPRVRKHLTRILLFASLSVPTCGYLQGMPDICAVFLVTLLEAAVGFSFQDDSGPFDALELIDEHVMLDIEADTFGVFVAFLEMFSPVFVDVLDAEALKIHTNNIQFNLQCICPELVQHLEALSVDISIFAHRFNFCFLTREMSLRASQTLFMNYISLRYWKPKYGTTEFVFVHWLVIATFIDQLYAPKLLRLQSFEEIVLFAQSAPLLRANDQESLVENVFDQVETTKNKRKLMERTFEIMLMKTVLNHRK